MIKNEASCYLCASLITKSAWERRNDDLVRDRCEQNLQKDQRDQERAKGESSDA